MTFPPEDIKDLSNAQSVTGLLAAGSAVAVASRCKFWDALSSLSCRVSLQGHVHSLTAAMLYPLCPRIKLVDLVFEFQSEAEQQNMGYSEWSRRNDIDKFKKCLIDTPFVTVEQITSFGKPGDSIIKVLENLKDYDKQYVVKRILALRGYTTLDLGH
ncbi:MAG: hypothetical protein ABSB95_10625 [Dissulfurispiraceae bacterium]